MDYAFKFDDILKPFVIVLYCVTILNPTDNFHVFIGTIELST